MYQLEGVQTSFDRLQLEHNREAQYNRDGHIREQALRDQLGAVKLVMVRLCDFRQAIEDATDTSSRIETRSLRSSSMATA